MYNAYRHRNYNLSHTKRHAYADEMHQLETYFDHHDDWSISSHLDSCYRIYPEFTVRISNHSAQYKHNLNDENTLLINIHSSKHRFIELIETKIDPLLAQIKTLPLEKYRFINITNGTIHCFYKKYKTKQDQFPVKKG